MLFFLFTLVKFYYILVMSMLKNSVCINNGTVLTGFTVMENCAVMVEDGIISDVFSQKRLEQKLLDSSVRVIDAGGSYIAP